MTTGEMGARDQFGPKSGLSACRQTAMNLNFTLSNPPWAHYRSVPIVLIEATVTMFLAGSIKAVDLSFSLPSTPSSNTGNWIVVGISVSWLVLITLLDDV